MHGRQKSQEFPRWPDMDEELTTLFHHNSTHLTSLHYEEVALDRGWRKKVINFIQVDAPESQVEAAKITQSPLTQSWGRNWDEQQR